MAEEGVAATSETPVAETPAAAAEDTAAEVAQTPEATPTEAPVEGGTPAEKPAKPPTMKDFENAVRERARKRREAAEQAAAASQVGEQESKAGEEEGAAEPAEGEPEAPAESGEEEGEKPEGESGESQYVEVDVNPNLPQYQNQSKIRVADEMSARMVRALMNSNVKQNQADLEATQTQLAEYRKQIQELHERNDRTAADQTAWRKWESSEQGQAARAEFTRLKEMEQNQEVAEGTAEAYWRGASQGYHDIAQQEFQARVDQRTKETEESQAAEAAEVRQQFVDQAAANQKYLGDSLLNHPQYQEWFNEAIDLFDYKLTKHQIPDVKPGNAQSVHNAFNRFFRAQLFQHEPAIKAMQEAKAQKTAQEEKAVAEKAAEEKRMAKLREEIRNEVLADLANRRGDVPRPSPIGNLTAAARDTTAQPASQNDGPAPSEETPQQRQRAAENRIREKARQRAAMRR